MFKLYSLLKENNVDFHSKEINWKSMSWYWRIPFLVRNISFFDFYKIEVGAKFDKNVDSSIKLNCYSYFTY